MNDTAAVMDLWPSPAEFASDVGVTYGLVRVWRHRRSIPAEKWSAIEAAARVRGYIGATASDLAKVAAKQAAA